MKDDESSPNCGTDAFQVNTNLTGRSSWSSVSVYEMRDLSRPRSGLSQLARKSRST